LYALADAAVSALKVDGFPSTFSELFALQVPVVATNLPGYKGLLEDDGNALLFEPGDQTSLVRALDRFFSDASLADRLRAGGEIFAKKRADFRVTVDRFEALYHQSIEHRRRNK
jgi:glycosyltransferase involved in cell wall biosynthesis